MYTLGGVTFFVTAYSLATTPHHALRSDSAGVARDVTIVVTFAAPPTWLVGEATMRRNVGGNVDCKRRPSRRQVLTVFFVEQNLELVLRVAVEAMFELSDGGPVRELAVHEAAAAALLHHFGPVVAGDFAESLRAVHDRVVHDLGVRQQEAAVR